MKPTQAKSAPAATAKTAATAVSAASRAAKVVRPTGRLTLALSGRPQRVQARGRRKMRDAPDARRSAALCWPLERVVSRRSNWQHLLLRGDGCHLYDFTVNARFRRVLDQDLCRLNRNYAGVLAWRFRKHSLPQRVKKPLEQIVQIGAVGIRVMKLVSGQPEGDPHKARARNLSEPLRAINNLFTPDLYPRDVARSFEVGVRGTRDSKTLGLDHRERRLTLRLTATRQWRRKAKLVYSNHRPFSHLSEADSAAVAVEPVVRSPSIASALALEVERHHQYRCQYRQGQTNLN